MLLKKHTLLFLFIILTIGVLFTPSLLSTWNSARILLMQTFGGILAIISLYAWLNAVHKDHDTLHALVLVSGLLLFISRVFFYYAGGPLTWDELYYLYLSWFPEQVPHLLNRFFHIYLQRFFIILMGGEPFAGAKLFWTFQICTTGLITFFCAYYLIPTKKELVRISTGFLALLIYFAYPLVLDLPGVTYVDFTSMLFSALFIFLYIQAKKNHKPIIYSLMGLIFLLSIKTKEVGLCSMVFLLDRSLYPKQKISLNKKPALIAFGIGVFLGLLIIGSLDHFYLGDAFYSIRSENWKKLLIFNTLERDMYDLVNIFGTLTHSGVLFLLIISLYSLWKLQKIEGYDDSVKFIWYYCIIVLLFHLFSAISGARMIVLRFFVVLAPVFGILCSQIIITIINSFKVKKIFYTLMLMLCIVTVIFLPEIGETQGWEKEMFIERILTPGLVLVFLLLIFVECQWSELVRFVLVLLIIFSNFPAKLVAIHTREIVGSSERRFRPFAENSTVLQYSPDMHILISPDIYAQHQILGRDRESNLWMYSLIFLEKASLEQFDYEQYDQNLLLTSEYDHIFLSDQEWASIDERTKDSMLMNWSTLIKNEYTLLSKKVNSSG